MSVFKSLNLNSDNGEIRLQARAVSRGVAIGKIVCLHGKKRQFYRINLHKNQIEKEIRRFRAAVRLAKKQLKKLADEKATEAQASIFETHALILEDRSLLEKIEAAIRENQVNAEWAVKTVTDRYISIYKDIADEHLRERYVDLEDVTERLLGALGGGTRPPLKLGKNSVIVAGEIKPSTLVELSEGDLKAVVAENGGWTSHSFILARELSLPAVTGMKGILRRVETGETVIVDGFSGQIILHPSAETLRQFKSKAEQFQASREIKFEAAKDKLKTLDGREIKIRVNLDIPKGYNRAKRFGANGIGLYRSEFLFNQYKGFPSEKEQIAAYEKIADSAGEDGVRIRTFDLSLVNLSDEFEAIEKNPALGLRAIRLSFLHENHFRRQLCALLQASAGKNLDIVLPMISDVGEILRAREILNGLRAKLVKKKIKCGSPQLGVMIEVPSAVLMIDEIVREVDFINLGTNDLVQYLLGVDRDNEIVADWFRTLHPAVIRAVAKVLRAAENADKPAVVCGEMAGSPVYAPILIGLGATELSMNVTAIPRVRQIVSNIAFEEAAEIAESLQKSRTADEAEEFVRAEFTRKWKHLFPPEVFPAKKK
jgi:phosphoenolpyruvate-protein phosphotransferase (PTS system enzyme I)